MITAWPFVVFHWCGSSQLFSQAEPPLDHRNNNFGLSGAVGICEYSTQFVLLRRRGLDDSYTLLKHCRVCRRLRVVDIVHAGSVHNDSLWHPLHTKERDEISMFLVPCLQSSISTLSLSFLALFFCYAVSSCVYDHHHPYLVSERLFLAENKAFPYLRRALAHPRRALAIL